MRDLLLGPKAVKGRLKLYSVMPRVVPQSWQDLHVPANWKALTGWLKNTVLYDWATITANLLANGAANYRINGMYIEFANVANPDVPVTIPSFDRSGGIAYYNGLIGNPTVDYLRVPIIAATITSSDDTLYPGGNVVTFMAQSQGVTGTNGKPFNAAHNSVVYGAALVAMPDAADSTQDLVFSRNYPPTDQQQIKLASSQIGIVWELTLQ